MVSARLLWTLEGSGENYFTTPSSHIFESLHLPPQFSGGHSFNVSWTGVSVMFLFPKLITRREAHHLNLRFEKEASFQPACQLFPIPSRAGGNIRTGFCVCWWSLPCYCSQGIYFGLAGLETPVCSKENQKRIPGNGAGFEWGPVYPLEGEAAQSGKLGRHGVCPLPLD